jgi:cytochrome c biogenesis protein CcmG, thiol:disulfide interchange protein DsbE
MTAKRILAYGALLLVVGLLSAKYIGAVRATVRGEEQSSCSALDAKPLEAQAPGFQLSDGAGKQHSLGAHRGKIVLLHFWATWCPPCVEELPSLAKLQQQLPAKDFAVLTISVDEEAEELGKFLRQRSATIGSLIVLRDPSKKVAASYGSSKFPESFLIDREGVVRQKFVYKRDWASPTALTCLRSML